MTDDLILSPFERHHFGRRNEYIYRRNPELQRQAVEVIRRRTHPAWSRFADGYRVSEEAA